MSFRVMRPASIVTGQFVSATQRSKEPVTMVRYGREHRSLLGAMRSAERVDGVITDHQTGRVVYDPEWPGCGPVARAKTRSKSESDFGSNLALELA